MFSSVLYFPPFPDIACCVAVSNAAFVTTTFVRHTSEDALVRVAVNELLQVARTGWNVAALKIAGSLRSSLPPWILEYKMIV